MKKINKYIKYVAALALLPVVTACFTGIENTGRITDRDVARVKANKRTAEEALLDSVKPQTYGGAQGGVRIPYQVAFCGNRKQVKVNIVNKKPTVQTGS